ncbi:MAG: helix-turn-helix domain-containing protein [Proteobacteria bacterium]|nr:helix-turn-helix domain-containing protein [Pseudomonadota bacterium]
METPGLMLKREREARGMTLSELSKVTRIPESALSHIENNEFDEFPAEVFVRGFLRNYARQLSLSPAEVIRAYEEMGPQAPAKPVEVEETLVEYLPNTAHQETAKAENDNEVIHHTSMKLAYIAIFLIAFAGIGLSVLFISTGEAEETDADYTIQTGETSESPFLISNTSEGWIE